MDQIAKASSWNATASRQFVSSSTASSWCPRRTFCTNACPRDDHPSAMVLLEPTHRTDPRLEATVIGLGVVAGYRSVRCQAAGSSPSSTAGYTGA
jgi:hypothetical protein